MNWIIKTYLVCTHFILYFFHIHGVLYIALLFRFVFLYLFRFVISYFSVNIQNIVDIQIVIIQCNICFVLLFLNIPLGITQLISLHILIVYVNNKRIESRALNIAAI